MSIAFALIYPAPEISFFSKCGIQLKKFSDKHYFVMGFEIVLT